MRKENFFGFTLGMMDYLFWTKATIGQGGARKRIIHFATKRGRGIACRTRMIHREKTRF